MKKKLSLLFFLAIVHFLFAAPSWVTDQGRRKFFPEAEYISALGSAFNQESAKNKAAAGISEYIKTEVSSSTKSRYSASEKAGKVTEESELEEEVSLISNSDLYALEYTEVWKEEDSGRFYCVAFIEKSSAWKIVNQKLQKINMEVSGLLEGAEEDRSGFWKTLRYGQAAAFERDFYSLYDFANLVNKSGVVNFVSCEQNIQTAKNALLQNKATERVLLTIQNDKNGMVYRALASYFEANGFTVSSERGKYICNALVTVEVRDDKSSFVAYPGLTLTVTDVFGSQIASYNATAKKTVGFNKDSTIEKSYRTLESACEKINWIN